MQIFYHCFFRAVPSSRQGQHLPEGPPNSALGHSVMLMGISFLARQEKETEDSCKAGSRTWCLLCPAYSVSWEGHPPAAVPVQPLSTATGHGPWQLHFLLIAGDKRWQERSSSSSVFPNYNPGIFGWCFWLKELQKLNLQRYQTSAPRGADNSLSNVISIDLKMRFAVAILCGIWSPLMTRSCSGWNVSCTAQLLTPEQAVGPGSFTALCWNTGWYPWWMKDLLSVLTLHADCHTDNTWLHWYFIRPKPSIVSSRNSWVFFSLQMFLQHSIKYWWEMR